MVPLPVVEQATSLDKTASDFKPRHSRLKHKRPFVSCGIRAPGNHRQAVCAPGFYPCRACTSCHTVDAVEAGNKHDIIRAIETESAVETAGNPLIWIVGKTLQLRCGEAPRFFSHEAGNLVEGKPVGPVRVTNTHADCG